ncbi:MAG: hypothetical protein VKP62_05735 [Candidatus Sericytochromatia bacterium]|nr:hypothetical protein [Candidatus Sericytochromatia bacterium]
MSAERTLRDACVGYASVAIAGTAKNAGKTTALNHLIAAFSRGGERLGLSSIGRDGEAVDQITHRPKPRIVPPVGTLVATSHESALYSQATLVLREPTPFRTALGPVGIYEVRSAGFVEVAGPVKVREAAALLRQLQRLGAERVLLDGAADRRAFISCGVDAFVLATGLVLGEDVSAVVSETKFILDRLQLPEPAPAWQARCLGLDAPGALSPAGFTPWVADTLLSDLGRLPGWLPAGAEALYVPGAVSDALLEVLLEARLTVDLIVPSGTHLLASQEHLGRWMKRGRTCHALRPVRAIALTVNPTAPDGRTCAPEQLRMALSEAFPDLPVFDVEASAPER